MQGSIKWVNGGKTIWNLMLFKSMESSFKVRYTTVKVYFTLRGAVFIAHFVLTSRKYGSAQGFLPLGDGLRYSLDVCLKITVECKSVGTWFRVYGISKIMAFRNQKFILLLSKNYIRFMMQFCIITVQLVVRAQLYQNLCNISWNGCL